jgi:hypothetical protein
MLLSERKVSKDNILYYFNCMPFGKGKTKKASKKIIGCQRKEIIGRTQMIFRAVKILCMSNYCHIHFSEHIECTIIKLSLTLLYGPLVIMICQHRFISYNKCTTVVGNVNSERYYRKKLCTFFSVSL